MFLSLLDDNTYSKLANLEIQPQPKQFIRVFMLFKPIEDFKILTSSSPSIDIKECMREANVVFEWGAMHIH